MKTRFVKFAMLFAIAGSSTGFAQGPRGRGPGGPPGAPLDPQTEMQGTMQRAYDGLNRSAALVAASGQNTSGAPLGTLIDDSKASYQEALSRYQASDFIGARELAAAATDLSRAAEDMAMQSIGSTNAAGVTPPPNQSPVPQDAYRANDEVARAGNSILQVQSMSNYTNVVPAETSRKVRDLLGVSQRLQQRAQTLLAQNRPQDASASARASDAVAHAADHLQNRYLMASGIVPMGPAGGPPPPPPGGPGAPPPAPGAGATPATPDGAAPPAQPTP